MTKESTPAVLGGILAVFGVSFVALAMIPALQLGSLQPAVNEDTGDIYPIDVAGQQAQGRQVYVAQGCVACHTEQVRAADEGADLDRGWGVRRTVARDYIYENPVVLGYMRQGPDLANIGSRKDQAYPGHTPDPDRYNAAWHYLHLYNPQDTSPGTDMPDYRFLFEKKKIVGQPDPDALKLPDDEAPAQGWEIVPTTQARDLVAYLTLLDHSHPLPEAGPNLSPSPTPAAAAAPGGSK